LTVVKPRKGYKLVTWLFGKMIEIPEEWEKTTTGKHVSILLGNAFASNEFSKNPNDVKLLRGDNIGEGTTRWKEKTRYWSKYSEFKKYQLFENDFVISMDGSKVGKNYAYIKKQDIPCLLVQRVACLRSKSTLIQKYLGYIFGNNIFINYVNSVRTNSGIPHISANDIQNFPFLLPSFSEQEKITSILSNVDSLIDTTEQIIENSKSLKTGLMQKLLTRGIDHSKFKKVPWMFSNNIEIPEEWEVKTFDDIFEFIISGTNARSDLNDSGEIGYIHYGDIHTKWNLQLDCDLDTIPRIDKEKVSRLQLLKEGDLIIADASEDVEGSGTSISLKNVKNKKIVAGLHTLVLRRKNENISFDFMKYLTSISSVKIQITSWVTGAKVFGLTKENSKKIKFPLPTFVEQQKISKILSNIDSKITLEEQHKAKLQKLKKSLIQKLLTGEVRVKV
jgi:type I restriction enzyme, S subunit